MIRSLIDRLMDEWMDGRTHKCIDTDRFMLKHFHRQNAAHQIKNHLFIKEKKTGPVLMTSEVSRFDDNINTECYSAVDERRVSNTQNQQQLQSNLELDHQ